MKTLPLLISVPHGGLLIPGELEIYTDFTPDQVRENIDQGSQEIFYTLETMVAAFVSSSYARCFIDMNRDPDDRGVCGVVKRNDCLGKGLYHTTPPEALLERLIDTHHTPYHEDISRLALASGARLAIDCHTMGEFAPPDAPDPEGSSRPMICISDRNGLSANQVYVNRLTHWLQKAFEGYEVKVNSPFSGGYTLRAHSTEIPYIQIEVSRTQAISDLEKSARLVAALTSFCEDVFGEQEKARFDLLAWIKNLFPCLREWRRN